MSKLLQRLSDAGKSGVYRTARADDILDATQGGALQVVRINLAGADRQALMERVAQALAFPEWFGGTWDALEDCLTDLSWSKAPGHVLLIEDAGQLAGDERGILVEILVSAAGWWAERKRPFFAVFVGGAPPLPELYKSGK